MANSTRGLDLLVIGGGIAGLTFAIDAHFSGHKVRIFEKRSGLSDFGKHTFGPLGSKAASKCPIAIIGTDMR